MYNIKARVYRVREAAKLPVRAHASDAGMDLYYCPESGTSTCLLPNTGELLQTGIKIQVPSGHMLQVMNKSGIASKRSLITGACVVDEGYTGEIFVNLHNVGLEKQYIEPGQKIAQAVFVKIEKPEIYEIRDDNLYGIPTSRGTGALGSTGD